MEDYNKYLDYEGEVLSPEELAERIRITEVMDEAKRINPRLGNPILRLKENKSLSKIIPWDEKTDEDKHLVLSSLEEIDKMMEAVNIKIKRSMMP